MCHLRLVSDLRRRVIGSRSGVREPDPGGDRDQFDRAGLRPAVALAAGQVPRGDLGPGQRGELAVQARLVAFDGEQVVRATPGEVVGVTVLGVQGISGDDRAGEVDTVEQWGERGDLVGLAVHTTTL